jgi:hypothetical protein
LIGETIETSIRRLLSPDMESANTYVVVRFVESKTQDWFSVNGSFLGAGSEEQSCKVVDFTV